MIQQRVLLHRLPPDDLRFQTMGNRLLDRSERRAGRQIAAVVATLHQLGDVRLAAAIDGIAEIAPKPAGVKINAGVAMHQGVVQIEENRSRQHHATSAASTKPPYSSEYT